MYKKQNDKHFEMKIVFFFLLYMQLFCCAFRFFFENPVLTSAVAEIES